MKSRMCYLAAPIDFAEATDTSWIHKGLTGLGFVVYDAGWAMSTPGKGYERDERVSRLNREALELSDCLLALLPHRDVTYGVPMEIEHARQVGLPIGLVVAEGGSAMSWSLTEFKQFLDWRDAVDYLNMMTIGTERRQQQLKVESLQGFKWEGVAPRRGYDDDAGFDLMVAMSKEIQPGQFADVDAGVKVELPPKVWAMITGRSSTLRRRGLLVNTAIIDSGYRGPLFAGVWNLTDSSVIVNEGERIAQLIPMPNLAQTMAVQRVEKLSEGTRGEKGFGSSGT